MRLPGAALLIVIGLLLLWAAITGRLDRLATAWDFVKGDSELPAANSGGGATAAPIINQLNSLLHRDTYHVAAMQNAISGSNGVQDYPGGVL